MTHLFEHKEGERSYGPAPMFSISFSRVPPACPSVLMLRAACFLSCQSILGNTSGLWSTTPFSNSIWSSNLNSTLPFTTPANTLPSIGLMGTENSSAPHAPSTSSPADDLGQTYNPWRIWSPTIGRRSSDPWSNSHFPHEN